MSGVLWVVGTPLGNIEDMSPRGKRILDEVDSILAEDTRVARKLLGLLGLHKKSLYSFCGYTEEKKRGQIISLLKGGMSIALISDAGMPAISDPGYLLVQQCHKENIPVYVIPGPSSITTALSGSGIMPLPFTFLGFLPRSEGDRARLFHSFRAVETSLIFFERKNRVAESLRIAYKNLGEREACIARELTKIHEEYILFSLSEYHKYTVDLKGELTIVIGKPQTIEKSIKEDVIALYSTLPNQLSVREKIKILQEHVTGYTSKELYVVIEEYRKMEIDKK